MSAWHRWDVETAALTYLTTVVGPVSARQLVDGLLARGRAQATTEPKASRCDCYPPEMHEAACAQSVITHDGAEYSAAHWYRDAEGALWLPVCTGDRGLELLCNGDPTNEPLPLGQLLEEYGPLVRTEHTSGVFIDDIRGAEGGERPC